MTQLCVGYGSSVTDPEILGKTVTAGSTGTGQLIRLHPSHLQLAREAARQDRINIVVA